MLISNKSALARISDFQHEPLPHPITHIRLLEVLPLIDGNDTTVQCRLRCVRLNEIDLSYTALSYTWSRNDAGHVIFINGRAVKVRSNLHNFLTLYRRKLMLNVLPTVFLWIDALCLNYDDVRERNSQVQIMPNIVQRAKTVLAWLEPLPELAGIATGRTELQSFVEFLRQVRKDIGQPQNFHNDRHLATKYLPAHPDLSVCPYEDEWQTLLQLCQHRYWDRLWVLQENRFAQNLMYMHGDTLWSWSDFRAPFVLMWYMAGRGLYDLSHSFGTDPAQILYSPAADIVKSRLVFEPTSKFAFNGGLNSFTYADAATERWHLTSIREPLSDLLKTHKHRLCSDRVDKVYALVGLSDSTLTVDYDRSNIELFCAVLLSLQMSLGLDSVSMLAHHFDVSAFQYRQNRRSLLLGVPSTMVDQSTGDIMGRACHTAYRVKSIHARTEISDILQARLGVQKLNYYCITAQQSIDKMIHWNDFPPSRSEMPRIHGYKPGTQMPIIDGFDLADTSFRAAMFINPSGGNSCKPVLSMASMDSIQDGDVLVTDHKMYSGIIIRVSGLSKTWLTVVGVVLFARKVTVESELLSPVLAPSPTSTMRSATLSEFCEHIHPTPFTITGCEDREHFVVKPHSVHLQGPLPARSSPTSGHSRSSSKMTNSTVSSVFIRRDDKRLTSKSERFERILEVLGSRKRRNSK